MTIKCVRCHEEKSDVEILFPRQKLCKKCYEESNERNKIIYRVCEDLDNADNVAMLYIWSYACVRIHESIKWKNVGVPDALLQMAVLQATIYKENLRAKEKQTKEEIKGLTGGKSFEEVMKDMLNKKDDELPPPSAN